MAQLRFLTVHIGGLCMLVQRKKANALYVLMPKVAHEGAGHCPLISVGPGFGTNAGRTRRLDRGDKLDFRGLNDSGKVVSLKHVADVSRFSGQRVARECFDWSHPNLAACVVLPLPAEASHVRFPDDMYLGRFRVPPTYDSPGTTFAGQCWIDYKVLYPAAWKLNIDLREVEPDDDGRIELSILNVRRRDLEQNRRYRHSRNQNWTHGDAYYTLLYDAHGDHGPAVLIDDDFHGEADVRDNRSCVGSRVRYDMVKPEFIDPYTCTLGGGCGPNNDDC